MEGRSEGAQMRGGWVYIMTNRPNGILYTGVTRRPGTARSMSRAEAEPPRRTSRRPITARRG
jgi:predicted GIY-YIG superfamily endonuclease